MDNANEIVNETSISGTSRAPSPTSYSGKLFRRKIAVALCGFYFVQLDRKSGAEFCAPTPLYYYLYFCVLLVLFLHRLVGLRLLRLCLKLRRGFAP